ncbi:MAG: D-alanyl-D-alanine carboxypeptidase/D-alanyl-D-alanine-endopeptidase [Rhodoferax sp.]|nr:D-alanyl-D-alanine carboxypeptidase/D-alanyl-D-alanine-endopeptidase [Rhodoferax sp.]MDP3653448.1 D-alanyl-D-alanine carboxypeptidase/D-alanyl-D-alanine-endopeptidase [Rhodoferax sp.]
MPFRVLLLAALCGLCALSPAQPLPPEVHAALARAKVPSDAVAVLLVDAQGQSAPRLSHRAAVPMNPASVMKLVTTYAALDLLGPAYTWRTPVYLEGAVREGTLYGNLYIQGQGDPKLVLERLWLLLRRVQGLGIHTIAGDVVLDRSAFEVPETNPASFDGEPLRPYNASPDALLINYKAVVMTFSPDSSTRTAQVQFDPPLAGVQVPTTVPLLPAAIGVLGECGDYRGALKADFSDPSRIRFAGGYPLACGEKVWPVAYADPPSYAVRAVQGLWQSMGGKIGGNVRMGTVPAMLLGAAKPAFEVSSAPLAEVIRDINKYSNNVMAQQVFLTLGRVVPLADAAPADAGTASTPPPPGSFAASRAVLQRWWTQRVGPNDAPVLDNGSGLSRQERISAQGLARLLHNAYLSPLMPELMASLPITGVDGTLKRAKARTSGGAHLKTGSLSHVVAVAGYVHAASGKRYVLVALINHANANAARPALDALVDWAIQDH